MVFSEADPKHAGGWEHLCIEEVTLRVSARVCTTPWVAKTRLKVKPMADRSTLMGRSLRCTRKPPSPYRANSEQCTAVLHTSGYAGLSLPPKQLPNLSNSGEITGTQ